jgi:hypothetical protein
VSPSLAPVLVVLAAGAARRYGGCKPLAPVGPWGEAVIDLVASDAMASGFGAIVLVVHPETGPAIRYHVERSWPSSVEVNYAEQRVPLGTTHATLAARSVVGTEHPFAVANADDVYGLQAFGLLSHQLTTNHDEHALVGFELANSVVTDDPVTRGICEVDPNGHLVAMTERRQVARLSGGNDFSSLDGLQPDKLPGEATVSVNLWGFRPEIWDLFDTAMNESGLDEEAILDRMARGVEVPKAEVLLPEVIGSAIESGTGLPVRVLRTDTKCVGVTHADDLPVVQGELSRQVAWGIRPSKLWGNLD